MLGILCIFKSFFFFFFFYILRVDGIAGLALIEITILGVFFLLIAIKRNCNFVGLLHPSSLAKVPIRFSPREADRNLG